jgi:colanic acid/amylovoran biosynthesis glycosyltransferase
MPSRICYFTNVYPAPSHTTMRREIRALEALGAVVTRVAARRFQAALVEPADREEESHTAYTAESLSAAAWGLVSTALSHPLRFAKTVWDAIAIGSTSPRGIWRHLMYVGEACVLLRLSRGCGHIHANFGNATSIAILCRQLGGPPVSLRIHGPEEFESFSAAEWDWKLSHASFVAPISEYGSNKVRAAVHPRHRSKVRTLRCGVDAPFAEAPIAPLPQALHLVCVARLEPRKGHAVLLDAMALLQGAGLPVSLLLVGDGSLRAGLEQQARQFLRPGSVEFAGWRDGAGVLKDMQQARLVVLPSFAEGLPIVLMEAIAAGRAVVATRVAGVPELVIPGQTGWLVECGDAPALAAALSQALQSPDEALLRMAHAGAALVAEKHRVEELMRELLAACAVPEVTGAQPRVVARVARADN